MTSRPNDKCKHRYVQTDSWRAICTRCGHATEIHTPRWLNVTVSERSTGRHFAVVADVTRVTTSEVLHTTDPYPFGSRGIAAAAAEKWVAAHQLRLAARAA